MMALRDTSGVQPVITENDQAVSPSPMAISRRVSTRPINRPTISMAPMVPRPRGAITKPALTIG